MNLENEKWKDIIGYEGYYQVSNHGRVKSLSRYKRSERIRKFFKSKTGYLSVNLRKDNIANTFYVHRLVAMHFLNGDFNLTVNHKDGNKQNNHVDNLEWCTKGENNSHAHRIGLMNKKGENCNFAKLTEKQVIEILNELSRGVKGKDLAIRYGVSRGNISLIKNRKNWKHLK